MVHLSSIILDGTWSPESRTAGGCSQLLAITVFLLSAQNPVRERQRVEQDIQIAQGTLRERVVNRGTQRPQDDHRQHAKELGSVKELLALSVNSAGWQNARTNQTDCPSNPWLNFGRTAFACLPTPASRHF